MRLKNIPGAKERLDERTDLCIVDPETKINLVEIFKNDNPVHIEIGSGKGKFITGLAELNKDINYIAVEKYHSVLIKILDKLENSQLKNIKLMSLDASDILDVFDINSIDRIYLNFSDPWHKARHSKRRLTHSNFLEKYEQILKSGKEIHFKTDNRKLFEFSIESLNNYGLKISDLSLDLHKDELDFVNITTEYEDKYSDKGPIYRLVATFK